MSLNNNADSINHTQKILQQLRNDFLADLPDRYSLIEELVLSLQKNDCIESNFDELYRNVHSLKGSAGTFGVQIVTTVCHHLEDHLNLLDDSFNNLNDEFVDTCLAYVDLVKQAYNLALNDASDSVAIEETLKILRNEALRNKCSGLIVTGSNFMNIVCQNALEKLPVQLTTAIDGMDALDRLMQKKYDFVIIGNEISSLNGTAVTYALRASSSINHDTAVMMITTRDKSAFIRELGPDYVIKKDQQLSDNLASVTQEITQKVAAKRNRAEQATSEL